MNATQVWLDRLLTATNEHDLEALVGCFADDYQNVTPAHPTRGFAGPDQVRRNWEQIFASVADFRADVRAAAFDGTRAWTEWEMRGTRADGSAHHMVGVIVFDVVEGQARGARFFLEPVDADARDTVGDAVRNEVVR